MVLNQFHLYFENSTVRNFLRQRDEKAIIFGAATRPSIDLVTSNNFKDYKIEPKLFSYGASGSTFGEAGAQKRSIRFLQNRSK